MKTWNLGNTTVRNPNRIKSGLRVLKDNFEGKVFDNAAQKKFFEILLAEGLIEGDPPKKENRAASGRKWQSVCFKLGLVTRSSRVNGVISITEAGNALLGDEAIESDIFLRQMLKVQLPSPTEARLENASVHPFFLILKISVALQEKNMKPLNKEEIALFIQSAYRNDQAEHIIKQIDEYRLSKSRIKGRVYKRRYFLQQLEDRVEELYGERDSKKMKTLNDYSDTTARYSVITGIFTFGGQQTLVIKEDQINLAKAIVNSNNPKILDNTKFLEVFHAATLPSLPTDNITFLERDVAALYKRLNDLSKQTGIKQYESPVQKNSSVLQLKKQREDLEKDLIAKKEIQFYREQCRAEKVEDIKSLFESIKSRETIGGSDYLPAWAEWGVWRVFLSINTIKNQISETRGFKINSELFPIHHAKGGAADLLFEYENNVLVPAEITLETSERQFNMEGEAVKYHIKSIIELNQTSDVLGLFTAPSIHVATAHEFFSAEFYSQKIDGVIKLNIIPLTFRQLQSLLPGQKNACLNSTELIAKLKDLVNLKKNCKDGAVWLKQIEKAFAD